MYICGGRFESRGKVGLSGGELGFERWGIMCEGL